MLSDHDTVPTEDALGKLDARGMVLLPGNEITKGVRTSSTWTPIASFSRLLSANR